MEYSLILLIGDYLSDPFTGSCTLCAHIDVRMAFTVPGTDYYEFIQSQSRAALDGVCYTDIHSLLSYYEQDSHSWS